MITVTRRDARLEVALHAPPANEIGLELLGELERVLVRIHEERDLRAVLLHSTLPAGFSAGADLRALHKALREERGITAVVRRPLRLALFLRRIHAVLDGLEGCGLPVVAALHGVVFGGGLELALAAHLRVADHTARFAFPEVRLGLVPGFGGVPRLRREAGEGFARELLLTGRTVGAERAHQVGLVSEVVGAGHALCTARALTDHLARFDGATWSAARRFATSAPAGLWRERALFLRLAQRPTLDAALDRFVTTRDPRPYLP